MEIRVLHTSWTYEDDTFVGGDHSIGDDECQCGRKHKATKALLGGIAAAADAPIPAVEIVRASADQRKVMDGAVQSQAEGEKAYDKAVASGKWQEGNVQAHLAVLYSRLATHEDAVERGDVEGRLNEYGLAMTRFAIDQSEFLRGEMEKGASFEQAAASWHRERVREG